MALRALVRQCAVAVRQTTRAKPKLALHWLRDMRRAYPSAPSTLCLHGTGGANEREREARYPRFSPQPSFHVACGRRSSLDSPLHARRARGTEIGVPLSLLSLTRVLGIIFSWGTWPQNRSRTFGAMCLRKFCLNQLKSFVLNVSRPMLSVEGHVVLASTGARSTVQVSTTLAEEPSGVTGHGSPAPRTMYPSVFKVAAP